MKRILYFFSVLFVLFYLIACSDSEKNISAPCLLTVDIMVFDVDFSTMVLVSVVKGAVGRFTYDWDVVYSGYESIVVSRNGTGLHGPGQHIVRVQDFSS